MIRSGLLGIMIALSACAEPPPPPVDGEIITQAVEHAQAQVDRARRASEPAKGIAFADSGR